MKGSDIAENNKASFADYCEDVYLNSDTLTKKQITDRIGNRCKRELKHLFIDMEKLKAGSRSDWHFQIMEDAKFGIHSISKILGEYRDAIKALNLKHHNIEANINRGIKNLSDYIPGVASLLNPNYDISKLRLNMTRLYKDETRKAVKAAIKDIRIEHHAYYLLQDAYEWSRKESTKDDKANLKEKVKHQKKVSSIFVIDKATEILNAAKDSGMNSDYASLALALAMVTGRRRSEIMKTARFEITDTTPANHIMFSGQLKTKDRKLFDDVAPYPIPCLVDPQLVIDCLKLLRKLQADHTVDYLDARGRSVVLTDNKGKAVLNAKGNQITEISVLSKGIDDIYHNEAVSAFYASILNTRAKQVFNCPDVEFRNVRDIYSSISFDEFRRDGEGPSAYRTRVYGHAGDSQAHYEQFEIDDSVDSIVFPSKEDKPTQYHSDLVKALADHDAMIAAHVRSPNYNIIHQWLKAELKEGLDPAKVTPSYIRRYCMVNGKMLNLNTIKSYLDSDKDNAVTVHFSKLVAEHGGKLTNINAGRPKGKKATEEKQPIIEPENKPVTKPITKPKVSAKTDKENGVWVVDIVHDGATFEVNNLLLNKYDRVAAMTKAWSLYQEQKEPDLPAVMPEPTFTRLFDGKTMGQVKIGKFIACEVITKGTNAFVTRQLKAQYQNLLDKK